MRLARANTKASVIWAADLKRFGMLKPTVLEQNLHARAMYSAADTTISETPVCATIQGIVLVTRRVVANTEDTSIASDTRLRNPQYMFQE
jgi:hypothetical protein